MVMSSTEFLGDFPESRIRDYSGMMPLDRNRRGQLYGNAGNQANLLVSGVRTLMDRTIYDSRFGGSNALWSDMLDARKNPFGRNYVYNTLAIGYQGYDIFGISKFFEYFVYSNQSAGIGQPYVNIPLLTIDETYLYRVEAYIIAGDLDKAAKMMGYFAKFSTVNFQANNENTVTSQSIISRVSDASEYQPYYTMNENQRKMTKYLANMRKIAFMHQGNRWFEIKRYNLPVTHRLVDGPSEVLEAKDLRKAVQIPRTAISFNLTPNPR